MFQKPNTIIACLHSERSDYILELNKFIRKNDPNITILATENKKIYAKGQWIGIYRPLICFDYNPKKDQQFCFFMTGNKDYHKRDDPRFYFFDSNDKLRIDNPIWIPTRYLQNLNFVNLKQQANKIVKWKIYNIEQQFNQAIKNKDEIFNQYLNIKYAKEVTNEYILKCHEQMTARDILDEKFCGLELKKIKEQEIKKEKENTNESIPEIDNEFKR